MSMSIRAGFTIVFAAMCATAQTKEPIYWPAGQWRTATPESQGLDSQAIAAAIDQVAQKKLGVHSLLAIRHGYAVVDAYFYPYDAGTPHDLASVTKTITSTLTGAAVANGVLKLNQPVLPLFPAERPADADERKRKITIEDLLRMQSGFDCGYLPGEKELEQMKRSENWVHFALSLPMKYEPGTRPSYCSPGYHLLGSAIGVAAHMDEREFGRKYLFEPLGMRPGVWAEDPQGRNHGWGDSHFFPADVAKVGYLYLHGGEWNGRQIVPKAWVEMSVKPPTGSRTDAGGLGYEWNVTDGPNGLQFGGTGRGGQTLIVWPDLDMVVVSMGGGNTGQMAALIRQAVRGDRALADSPVGFAGLRRSVAAAAKAPSPGTISVSPSSAAAVSGAIYDFPVNASRLDSLSLSFTGENKAEVTLKYYGTPLTMPVGLDGVYRLGPYGPFHLTAGATGKWIGENEFLLDINFVANINHYTLNIRFNGDRIDVRANEASGLMRDGELVGVRSTHLAR